MAYTDTFQDNVFTGAVNCLRRHDKIIFPRREYASHGISGKADSAITGMRSALIYRNSVTTLAQAIENSRNHLGESA
ncbi:MAG TPA: hypothetical protein VJ981_02565 [Gammaproteobacteria bacterium]|nr:hypothetical protein [Gammaproteobacteria bacterium]